MGLRMGPRKAFQNPLKSWETELPEHESDGWRKAIYTTTDDPNNPHIVKDNKGRPVPGNSTGWQNAGGADAVPPIPEQDPYAPAEDMLPGSPAMLDFEAELEKAGAAKQAEQGQNGDVDYLRKAFGVQDRSKKANPFAELDDALDMQEVPGNPPRRNKPMETQERFLGEMAEQEMQDATRDRPSIEELYDQRNRDTFGTLVGTMGKAARDVGNYRGKSQESLLPSAMDDYSKDENKFLAERERRAQSGQKNAVASLTALQSLGDKRDEDDPTSERSASARELIKNLLGYDVPERTTYKQLKDFLPEAGKFVRSRSESLDDKLAIVDRQNQGRLQVAGVQATTQANKQESETERLIKKLETTLQVEGLRSETKKQIQDQLTELRRELGIMGDGTKRYGIDTQAGTAGAKIASGEKIAGGKIQSNEKIAGAKMGLDYFKSVMKDRTTRNGQRVRELGNKSKTSAEKLPVHLKNVIDGYSKDAVTKGKMAGSMQAALDIMNSSKNPQEQIDATFGLAKALNSEFSADAVTMNEIRLLTPELTVGQIIDEGGNFNPRFKPDIPAFKAKLKTAIERFTSAERKSMERVAQAYQDAGQDPTQWNLPKPGSPGPASTEPKQRDVFKKGMFGRPK